MNKTRPAPLRCSFDVVTITDDEIVLRDANEPGKMSLTNDVEGVVAWLLFRGTLRPGMRLAYYDSTNRLDEIDFDENGFKAFKPAIETA